MANIFPFKGVLYNREKVHDISLVTAPPYDVISEAEQDKYYRVHEYNIVRLILGKGEPSDTPGNDRYSRAAHLLGKWFEEKVLIEDEVPCMYLYSQDYKFEGEMRTQRGFICILRLEEFSRNGGVLPHEKTLSRPKEDRLKLMRACHANLSPIFGLYSDHDFHLDRIIREGNRSPIIDFGAEDGIKHRMFRVSDSGVIKELQESLCSQRIYIADGHHRYETAIAYRNERKEKEKSFTGEEFYNHIMIYLVNMDSDGLAILPAHRLVKNISVPMDGWESRVDEFFIRKRCSSFEEMSKLMRECSDRESVFGLYSGGSLHCLILKDREKCAEVLGADIPEVYKSLDVIIAHRLILNRAFNDDREIPEDNIAYVKDWDRALKLVDDGEFVLAVFLNPTRVEQVEAIASSGRRMPGKATYFYPKPLSGLVMNRLTSEKIVTSVR